MALHNRNRKEFVHPNLFLAVSAEQSAFFFNFHGQWYFNTFSDAVKTGLVAWLKIAFSRNPNYKEGETYMVVIRSIWKIKSDLNFSKIDAIYFILCPNY
jgi:hypothetical protein